MSKRVKTKYPGVYYREAQRIGGTGKEKVYYILFKKDSKVYEEKAGRQFMDQMTPAKAARIRSERIEGKRQSRRTLRELQEAERKAQLEKWTIERLLQEYLSQRPLNKSLRTDINRYQNHLAAAFGKKQPNEIIQLDVDRLRINLLKKISPQTVKHVLALLARIVSFGVRKGLCEGLSFRIEMPKLNNLKTEDLSPEQLERLMDSIERDSNIQAANLMKMALFTGMRRGELFRLKWEDIDFQLGFIHIKGPKGGKDQKIPLNDAARSVLLKHPHLESPFVFPGRKGAQRTDIRKQVDRIKKRAGLPKDFRPLHGLRHVYASILASSGRVDMYTLQKMLTHKSPAMTQRYAHLRDEALKRASDVAGDIFQQISKGL